MRPRNTTSAGDDKIDLQMTPMIDIVFQLLIFFIMTFKIVAQEGDFSIKMPQTPSRGDAQDRLPPIQVRLTADGSGQLTGIHLGQRPLGRDFDTLRAEVLAIIGSDRGPGSIAELSEIELDCDYNLNYEYVIEAITHVSGYTQGGNVVKMIEKVKFARQRQAG